MRRQFSLPALTIVALVIASVAAAADPNPLARQPSEEEIARAVRALPKLDDADIERAVRAAGRPSASDIAKTPAPSAPRLEALPVPLNAKDVDLRAVTKGYEKQAADMMAGATALSQEPVLLIFVSFSLAEPTLQRLIDQAARSSAALVLRGLTESSLKATVLRIQALIGQHNVAFKIDPQAFERFGVAQAPTFVLIRAGAQPLACGEAQCLRPESFVSVAGDVSVDYALEHIQRNAPAFAAEAQHFLKRLRG